MQNSYGKVPLLLAYYYHYNTQTAVSSFGCFIGIGLGGQRVRAYRSGRMGTHGAGMVRPRNSSHTGSRRRDLYVRFSDATKREQSKQRRHSPGGGARGDRVRNRRYRVLMGFKLISKAYMAVSRFVGNHVKRGVVRRYHIQDGLVDVFHEGIVRFWVGCIIIVIVVNLGIGCDDRCVCTA